MIHFKESVWSLSKILLILSIFRMMTNWAITIPHALMNRLMMTTVTMVTYERHASPQLLTRAVAEVSQGIKGQLLQRVDIQQEKGGKSGGRRSDIKFPYGLFLVSASA